MAKGTQLRRLMWLALLLASAFAGLGYRLVDLQVLRHEELSAQGAKEHQREFDWNRAGATFSTPKATCWRRASSSRRSAPTPLHRQPPGGGGARAGAVAADEREPADRAPAAADSSGRQAARSLTNVYVVLKHKVPVENLGEIQHQHACFVLRC